MDPRIVHTVLDKLVEIDPEVEEHVRYYEGDVVSALCDGADADGNRVGPFSRDSTTSKKAAYENFPRSGSQRHRVLQCIADAGTVGRTRDEVARELDLPDSGTDARVWELSRGGWIKPNGESRKTPLGGDAEVLTLTFKGWTRMRSAGI